MRRAAQAYSRALAQRPLRTKTLTGLALACAGDVSAQESESRLRGVSALADPWNRIDARRLAAFSTFGALWTGPVNHVWLPVLHRVGGSLGRKLLVQHAFLNPFVYLPAFFVWNSVLRGEAHSLEDVLDYGRERFLTTYASTLAFWVPVTSVVFTRVPEPLQSVSMAAVSLVWNGILSFLANVRSQPGKGEPLVC